MTGVIDRNKEEHMKRLQVANSIRTERAKLRKEVFKLPRKEAFAMVFDLLTSCPRCLDTMLAFEVVQWPYNVGPSWVRRLFREAKISERRLVKNLTNNEIERLKQAIGGMPLNVKEESKEKPKNKFTKCLDQLEDIKIPITARCVKCRGKGIYLGNQCKECEGRGRVNVELSAHHLGNFI